MLLVRLSLVLVVALALDACSAPMQLLASLVPDGTTGALLGNLEKVPDQNRKRIAELQAAGRWEELAQFAEENIAKDSATSDWWIIAGYARTRLEQHARAAEAFMAAARIEPDNMLAWNLLAQSYRAAGDSRRAVNTLNSALNVTRDAPETLYLLGASYGDLQRYEDAARAYREAVMIEPRYAAAWYSLAKTYTELNRTQDAQEARARLEKLDPKLAARLDAR